MRKILIKILNRLIVILSGKEYINNTNQYIDIVDLEFWEIYNLCKQFTMTSVERMFALYSSVKYVLDNNIKGDFVECGVWRGGSALMIARLLKTRGISDRKLFMYDTYEGMPPPTSDDKDIVGKDAEELLDNNIKDTSNFLWCLADIDDVKNNMKLAGLEMGQIVFVKGKVEDTIPEILPSENIALLRLDTDWYESTKHELNHLYPKLSQNGILIIDDYGHWQGCKKAVDEYFTENDYKLLMNRVDYTGRLCIKNL